VDEDRLSPEFGRLIDAAKAAAAAHAAGTAAGGAGAEGGGTEPAGPARRAEGWAVLASDGAVHPGVDLASAVRAARAADASHVSLSDLEGPAGPVAAAFAVAGEPGETLLPRPGWRTEAEGLDPELPVAVKYLGRWVVVTLGELPG
jgi:hypothetical protein